MDVNPFRDIYHKRMARNDIIVQKTGCPRRRAGLGHPCYQIRIKIL